MSKPTTLVMPSCSMSILKSGMICGAMLLALSGLTGCQSISVKPVPQLHIVMMEIKQSKGLAILTEDMTVWCIKGNVRYLNHTLRAGQAFDGSLHTYAPEDLLKQFPKYNNPPGGSVDGDRSKGTNNTHQGVE